MTTPIDPRLVRPLVWEIDAPMGGFWFTAVSAVGIYRVRESYTGAVAWQFGTMGKWHEAGSIEAAQAAAQADYAARASAIFNPAALATMLAEARNDGIRAAAEICDGEERQGETGWWCRDQILALIKETQT